MAERNPGVDVSYFARGLAIGFAIAAPVGAIGLLCIRRTLASGRLTGLVSGLGAATADAFYGAVAALGLTVVSATLIAHQDAVRLVGGVFLLYLGLRTSVAQPVVETRSGSVRGLAAAYGSTLALTLTNPTTILSFVAVFAGLGLGTTASDRGSAALMVCGVFLGSVLWWLLLSGAIGFFRRALTPERLRWVNRVSGAMLIGFGVFSLLSLRT
jgi:threonine/homoserine/homoserine lactone efflux protein